VSVYSETYGLVGKIDLYYGNLKLLVERKTRIKKVHRGYIYQLYAQFFCLREMNIPVEKLALRSLSTNQSYQIDLPTSAEENDFAVFIKRIRNFDPLSILTNPNPNDLAGTSIYSELKF
jgi:CRISPR-associated protein Cas4